MLMPLEEIQRKFPGIDIDENKKYLEKLIKEFPDNRKIQAVYGSIIGMSNSQILKKYGIRTSSIIKWRQDFLSDKENFYQDSVGRVVGNRKLLQEKTSIEKVQELIDKEKTDSVFKKRLLVILDILKNKKLTLKDVADRTNLSLIAVTQYVSIAAKNGIEALKPKTENSLGQETVVAEEIPSIASITPPINATIDYGENLQTPKTLSEADSRIIADIYKTIDENPNINALSLTRLHVVLLMTYGFSVEELSNIFREKEDEINVWYKMIVERGASYYLNPNLFSAFVEEDKEEIYKTWDKFEVPNDIKNQKGMTNPCKDIDKIQDLQKKAENNELPKDDSERNKTAREYVQKYFSPTSEYGKITKELILKILSDKPLKKISEEINYKNLLNLNEMIQLRKEAWEGKFSQKGFLFVLSELIKSRLKNPTINWSDSTRKADLTVKASSLLNSSKEENKEKPVSKEIIKKETVKREDIVSSKTEKPVISSETEKMIRDKLGLKSKEEQNKMEEEVKVLIKKYPENARLLAIKYILEGYSFRKTAKLSNWGDSTIRRFCQLVREGGIQNLIRIDGLSA